MNRRTDTDFLLRDVLSEGSPPDLREALLAEILRLARRRRRFRGARNFSAVVALVGACAFLGWHYRQRQAHLPAPVAESFALVRTRPLAAGAVITTRPLEAGLVISSEPSTRIVRTSPMEFRVIDDRELLALVSPRPAILIQSGAASKELEFVNPGDRKEFQPQ